MEKHLQIYLQDHWAGSTAGLELAKRTAKSNRGHPEFGGPLQRVASEIDEDRESLRGILQRLRVEPDRIKTTLFWAGEKAGRLKPNGQLRGYSPLSRVAEIEGLISGVGAKLSLWRVLLDIQSSDPRLEEAQLTELADRAEDQLSRLYALRGDAARRAFMT